jgi:UDP-3-O-[3-hydroxymyristoyl] N-acetylglucosamine deacetylase
MVGLEPRNVVLSYDRQHTLRHPVTCAGIALHSGADVRMTLRPAAPGTGIVFRRTDVAAEAAEIPARYDHVGDCTLSTSIQNAAGTRIITIEHLMAALSGAGVDNLVIELDGPEVPAMDGSSAPFIFLIEAAGVVAQDAPRRAIRILEPVRVADGDRSVELLPGEGFSVDFEIDFASGAIARQAGTFDLRAHGFKAELARARTFGMRHEIDWMRGRGLALGGSLDNAVVVDGDVVMNDGGLRYPDEFVRHKALDAVGDLYLAGAPIIGRFRGVKSGHALNNRLLRTLFTTPGAYAWTIGRGAGSGFPEMSAAAPA